MTFDNEAQRQLILYLIAFGTFKGEALEAILAFKNTVAEAKIDVTVVAKEPIKKRLELVKETE